MEKEKDLHSSVIWYIFFEFRIVRNVFLGPSQIYHFFRIFFSLHSLISRIKYYDSRDVNTDDNFHAYFLKV